MPKTASMKQKGAALHVVKEPKPEPGNGPDRETFHYFVGLIDAEDAKCAAARKARKVVRQRAANAGLNLEIVDLLRKKRDKEAETSGSWMQSLLEGFKWMGLTVAVQLSLFPDEQAKQTVTERAEQEGYIDGLEGKTAAGDRYDVTSEPGKARLKGYHRGQEVVFKRFVEQAADLAP